MRDRTFFSTFLLFLVAIYTGIFILSLSILHDTTKRAKERCLGEHHFMAMAIWNDFRALEEREIEPTTEMKVLMQPYEYVVGNQNSALTLFSERQEIYSFNPKGFPEVEEPIPANEDQNRITIRKKEDRYVVQAAGRLPPVYGSYILIFQSDISDVIGAWRHQTNTMLIVGSLLSLVLAAFLLLLLEKLFRPLSQITYMSQNIAAGNYENRLPENGGNEIAQMACSFNHMAKEIQSQMLELQTTAENKQRFVDNFAHELRTPLTAIYGYTEYLQKAVVAEDDRQYSLECILAESSRIQTMANQLLELADLSNNQIRLEKLEMKKVFDDTMCTISQKAYDKKIQIKTSCKVTAITGDSNLIHILLVNLLDNAMKASAYGSEIFMEAIMHGEKPVILITDYGKGMETDELSKITEPYYQIEKSRNSKKGGAGLGLSICRQIARVHKAELQFDSIFGKGTTVKITFTSC